jgi:hypothetical protein
MRKVLAVAAAAVALSWASAVPADDAAKERSEAADATKEEMKQGGRDAEKAVRGEAERTRGDVAAPDSRTERGGQPGERSREGAQARMDDEKKHPLFEGKNNFDLDGKVAEVSADKITIQRNELPAATLHVSKNTKVEVDGEKASIGQLKRGQDVKASFNLQGDKVEAVEIKADKLEKDAGKEMREQGRETQKEMNERARESKQQK